MANLTLKCIYCKFKETIEMNATMFGFKVKGKGALRDAIEDKGWKLIKVMELEGYCCKECRKC